MIELRGNSWNHPRGHDPLVATARAYTAEHPNVSIRWETRSLQAFADHPVERLAEAYDLLVIDHPCIGRAMACSSLLPLDEFLGSDYLADQAANSVGVSHASYAAGGHQWALAHDVAAHVSADRPDLLDRLGVPVPQTWDEVLDLARHRARESEARVAIPLIPVDCWMAFCSISASTGEVPLRSSERVVSRSTGHHTLEILRALHESCHPESTRLDPPRLLDRMSRTDEIAYAPLLFGYSNYARPGFRPRIVRFSDVPRNGDAPPRGAVLGGAGIAISAQCRQRDVAVDYAAFVANGDIQRSLYFESGGQPGHGAAWRDPQVNAASSNFFLDTIETLRHAYLRPRYNGYLAVQETAGDLVHRWLVNDGSPESLLDDLDELYRNSLPNCW